MKNLKIEKFIISLTLILLLTSYLLLLTPSYADVIFSDDFDLGILNKNKWEILGSAKNVSLKLKDGVLNFSGKFNKNDRDYIISTKESLKLKGEKIELEVICRFSAKPVVSKPTGSIEKAVEIKSEEITNVFPPTAIIVIFDKNTTKGSGFWITSDTVYIVGTPEQEQSSECCRGTNDIFKEVKKIEEGSIHKYKIVYNSVSKKVSFYIDLNLVYEISKIEINYLKAGIGVSGSEGEGEKEINFADFDNFVLRKK